MALEAYPSLLARELIGTTPLQARRSRQADARPVDRPQGICSKRWSKARSCLGLRLKPASHAQRDELADDGSGDKLDAVLCLMQAAWADARPDYGLPAGMDLAEG